MKYWNCGTYILQVIIEIANEYGTVNTIQYGNAECVSVYEVTSTVYQNIHLCLSM